MAGLMGGNVNITARRRINNRSKKDTLSAKKLF